MPPKNQTFKNTGRYTIQKKEENLQKKRSSVIFEKDNNKHWVRK